MAKLIPFLFSEDARAQAAFYAEAIQGTVQSVSTFGQMPGTDETLKDKVMHLCLSSSDITIFMADAMDDLTRGRNFSLNLEFPSAAEGQAAFDHLSTDAVGIRQPLAPAPWGGQYGELEDKFGVSWMITCPQ
ncbi:VOC family protein [Paenibacillus athensensis]|uniref:PhnB-like domain-containing protein n=1 Tax=Paenibacillus athensensis TaxID=1967502 RepID=A0A4Y8QA35_9BACL|nr:VOC family protein [Paenibacillus athensensis]MCD1260119.1 VOC family protein [Paenibacillus athensensis]